jgi:hypothetical protein
MFQVIALRTTGWWKFRKSFYFHYQPQRSSIDFSCQVGNKVKFTQYILVTIKNVFTEIRSLISKVK